MQSRLLIVNADDANLTPGVNEAIFQAHEEGIVTSTTFLINLPFSPSVILAFQKRKGLGVGLHLNVSLGRPVCAPSSVPTLADADGGFRKRARLLTSLPSAQDLEREYEAQIRLFRKCFSRMPTHLDTHHQLHDHPRFLKVITALARRLKIPVRRSALWKGTGIPRGLISARRVLGDLRPEGYWRPARLKAELKQLSPGVSEIMCHPGIVDARLRRITSFLEGREEEFRLFRDPALRRQLERAGVRLTHYGMWYTW